MQNVMTKFVEPKIKVKKCIFKKWGPPLPKKYRVFFHKPIVMRSFRRFGQIFIELASWNRPGIIFY